MTETTNTTFISALREDLTLHNDQTLRIDEEEGVIYRAKLLGHWSPNGGLNPMHKGRDYTKALASNASAEAYDGRPYILEHTGDDGKMSVSQVLGIIKNTLIKEDETGNPAIYGDVHLDADDPLARKVLRLAKRFPELIANSHEMTEARLSLREAKDGQPPVLEVIEILHVDAVACVTRGGTMQSFFEAMEHNVSDILPFEDHTSELLVPSLTHSEAPKVNTSELHDLHIREALISLGATEQHLADPIRTILENLAEEHWPRLEEAIERLRRDARRSPSTLPLLTQQSTNPHDHALDQMRKQWSGNRHHLGNQEA